MVLDDVTSGTYAVVVAGSTTDPDVLGHRDLHIVDIVRVPEWLEHCVGESHGQDVLDCLLAQVMIDSKDRARTEHLAHDAVEFDGG